MENKILITENNEKFLDTLANAIMVVAEDMAKKEQAKKMKAENGK